MTSALRRRRIPLARALLGAAATAALVAALEPRIRAGRAPALRVLMHDASASCGARAVPDEDEIAALLDGLGSEDRVAVTSFGVRVGLAVGQCAPSELRSELARAAPVARPADPHGSSLFGTLLDMARPAARSPGAVLSGRRLELVLATDGRATDAPATPWGDVTTMLRNAGCASVRILPRTSVTFPSLVAELRGPGVARAGEPFALEARGVATEDDAVVELADGAGVVETRRVGAKGPFRLAFTRIEERTGPASFTARIAGADGIPAPVGRVVVTSPGRALVVGETRRDVPGVAGEWLDARRVTEDDVAALLAAHDVVVLDDLPAALLDPLGPRDGALSAFVQHGGGLVLLGGPHSFGAGGWASGSIESLSPLVAHPRDDAGEFLYLALDGSGSMAEPWSDAPGAATRDDVVRGAARALVRAGAATTNVAVRRFAADLVPAGAAATVEPLRSAGASIDGLPAPGGATALLPPLREALTLASSRPEKRRAALFLTDGRTPESAADLHAALAALDTAGVRVTFVLPGDGALDAEAHALAEALAGTKAAVRGVTRAELLAEVFRDVEDKARVDEPVVTERRLVADAGAAGLVDATPESVARADRAWLADGATQLVVTDRGEPVAALRRVGLGVVAALATRPGDAEWLAAGDGTTRLVASLVRAAARPASGRVRVERDGEARILARYEPPPGGTAPVSAELDRELASPVRVPIVPAAGGLLAAEWPVDARAPPQWISFLAADGRVLATAGLDTPAPAEYRDPPPVDLDALAALVSANAEPTTVSLAPWFAAIAAALAVASVAAARVKSRTGLAR